MMTDIDDGYPALTELRQASTDALLAPLHAQLDAVIAKLPRPARAFVRWYGRRLDRF